MTEKEQVNKVDLEIIGDKQTFFLTEKNFSTGSKGFHAQGKMALHTGKSYQVNILVVEIGSKPKEKKKKD